MSFSRRNYDSLPRKLREAWWILIGKYSLHKVWQEGYDEHIQQESRRRAAGGN